jgi:putative ABC transport system permease protein
MQLISVWREIRLRWRRHFTAILGLSIGLCLLLLLNALSDAYKEATKIPLQDVGADISIQRNGDVPEELDGVVFACSAVTIKHDEIEAIRQMDGVRSVAQAVLLWVFQGDQFAIVLGIEPESLLGPGRLKNYMVDGRYLTNAKEAILDESYAREQGLAVGDSVMVAEQTFSVVGLVAASQASKMVVAHIYIPLDEAQAMAAVSEGVQQVSPFAPEDANVLFLTTDQEAIPALSASLHNILGDTAAISTPDTFLRKLGTMFALSDRFAAAVGLIIFVVTFLLVFKTVAGGIHERAAEIAVFKCLGWTNSNLRRQIVAETLAQCLLAVIIGSVLAAIASWLLSFQTLDIMIPWEMAPTPHFLPGGGEPVFRTVSLPVKLSLPLIAVAFGFALGLGAIISLLCTNRISKIKPSEVLRHE